jgi:hypothetical protein
MATFAVVFKKQALLKFALGFLGSPQCENSPPEKKTKKT